MGRLRSWPRQSLKSLTDLRTEIQVYFDALEKFQTFQRFSADDDIEKPPLPDMPLYLQLFLELKRYPGTLLVAGGLLDQPELLWLHVNEAGAVYESILALRSQLAATATPAGGPGRGAYR